MRIIFATHNEDKLREIREIMREFPGEIKSKKEIGELGDVVENGSSFLENAEIKARDLYEKLKGKGILQDGDIVMADDSGLSIEALSFGPGIYSARFLGENTAYSEKNKRILAMLKEASNKSRYAYYTCAIVAILSDGKVLKTEARCEGEIAEEIKIARDFGDLSENSEYDEAKNEQAQIEEKIIKLDNMIANAKIIDDVELDTKTVNVGATVTLVQVATKKKIEYTIVGSAESNPLEGKISNESPVGRAILGKKKGTKVQVQLPNGNVVEYKIDSIKRN